MVEVKLVEFVNLINGITGILFILIIIAVKSILAGLRHHLKLGDFDKALCIKGIFEDVVRYAVVGYGFFTAHLVVAYFSDIYHDVFYILFQLLIGISVLWATKSAINQLVKLNDNTPTTIEDSKNSA